MHTIRVWAPLPKKVEVIVDGRTYPLSKGPDDWWSAEIAAACDGSRYGFFLDGQGPFADPRSRSQPDGITGLSALVLRSDFPWTDHGWQSPPLSAAIIYELHIGTFTPEGTFDAAITKLGHLKSLGVTHVELMPVNEFGGSHGWGYDGINLFAPHHAYGGVVGLKRFVNACHERKLAAILDVVYNHLGPSGNHLGKFAPYFTKKYSSPWGEALNYDAEYSDEVRRFFIDNALMWLRDFHSDGLRLDAVHAIADASAVHFLAELKLAVEKLSTETNRPLVLIPESDLNDPRLLQPRNEGGFNLDAQWSDDFHHALHSVLTGETNGYYSDFGSFAHLAKSFQCAFVYDGQYSPHHKRSHGRPIDGLSGSRFLAYLQNHDQVGNRAKGERSSQLMNPGRLKIATALVLLSPFVPMLFQGEEWGAATPFLYFTDHEDPELGKAVREGRRREFAAFGWKPEEIPDPQAPQTFERSKLDWTELETPLHREVLEWYRQLIRLRMQEPALRDFDLTHVKVTFDESARWFLVQRGDLTIACNLNGESQAVPLSAANHQILLAAQGETGTCRDTIQLPADSVAILRS